MAIRELSFRGDEQESLATVGFDPPKDDGEVVAIREHTLCGDQQGRFLGTPLEPGTTDDGEVVAIRSYPFVVMSKKFVWLPAGLTHPEDDGEVVAIREHTLCGDQQGRFLGTPLEPRTTDDGEMVASGRYPFPHGEPVEPRTTVLQAEWLRQV